jgi:hypothetical protein
MVKKLNDNKRLVDDENAQFTSDVEGDDGHWGAYLAPEEEEEAGGSSRDEDSSQWISEDDDESGGQAGGSQGVEFSFEISPNEKREDLLSSEDLKRRLKVHHDTHYDLVKKQKIERKTRNEIKEGKRPAVSNAYNTGNAGYGNQGNKAHPISKKAYFSGIDKQVIGVASENQANTNEVDKKELEDRLENRLANRLQHRHTPKFNPTPRPH